MWNEQSTGCQLNEFEITILTKTERRHSFPSFVDSQTWESLQNGCTTTEVSQFNWKVFFSSTQPKENFSRIRPVRERRTIFEQWQKKAFKVQDGM